MSDVFSDVPGRVDSVEHCIDTGEAPPFRLTPYRIPKAWESQVHQELQSLAELGIIEPCKSQWASPIVAVGKKDGNVRVCID